MDIYSSHNAELARNDIDQTHLTFHSIVLPWIRFIRIHSYAEMWFRGFVPSDGGQHWDAFNQGLPEGVVVFDLQLSPADNSLVAFTHGNGTCKADLNSLPVGTHSTTDAVSDFYTYLKVLCRSLLSCGINSNRNHSVQILYDSYYDRWEAC